MSLKEGLGRRIIVTVGSVRTGIILLLIVGVVSAAGTLILQRPVTSPDELQRAYSAQTLAIFDALGLTDVYHAWWYALLLALLAASIILASLERFPNAWRYYSRPYRRTDASFRAALPIQKSIPIDDPGRALEAAERVFRRQGFKPERIVEYGEVSLYAEKNRFAVLAVYLVHASLLLIMLGGILDGIWGYRGYVTLVPGQPAIKQIVLQNGVVRQLPFELRCDGAGQENYAGEYARMPKRWWSKLVVLENGREAERKEIAVNDPLVHKGIRFYQSGYGQSAVLRSARVAVITEPQTAQPKVVNLNLQNSAALDDGSSIRIARFFPDAYQMDGGIYQRSRDLNAAAAELEIRQDGQSRTAWLFRTNQAGMEELVLVGPYSAAGRPLSDLPYQLVASLEMAPFTGLQVSHEPGQWAVWTGCVLMGLGLVGAFWILHQRYWLVPTMNKEGRLVLWLGAAANKSREGFAVRFHELTEAVQQELHSGAAAFSAVQVASEAHS
jgi:cytochrome c biogenesis protein